MNKRQNGYSKHDAENDHSRLNLPMVKTMRQTQKLRNKRTHRKTHLDLTPGTGEGTRMNAKTLGQYTFLPQRNEEFRNNNA